MTKSLPAVLLSLVVVYPVLAQESDQKEPSEQAAQAEDAAKKEAAAKATAGIAAVPDVQSTLVDEILKATQLPGAADAARKTGVTEKQIKDVLETAKKNDLSAAQTEEVLEIETQRVQESGRTDDFGSFVNSKLDQGLRGRDLANSIHAEHAARGMGQKRGHLKQLEKDESKMTGKGKMKDKGKAKDGRIRDELDEAGDDDQDESAIDDGIRR